MAIESTTNRRIDRSHGLEYVSEDGEIFALIGRHADEKPRTCAWGGHLIENGEDYLRVRFGGDVCLSCAQHAPLQPRSSKGGRNNPKIIERLFAGVTPPWEESEPRSPEEVLTGGDGPTAQQIVNAIRDAVPTGAANDARMPDAEGQGDFGGNDAN